MSAAATTSAPAGPVLALDSSTATGSVAVGEAGAPRAEILLNVGPGHSSALLPAIDQALKIAGLRPVDLAAVVVAGGPGSFTGIRIAAATAKGIVQGLGLPLLAYSGLLAAAAMHASAPGPVWGVFDARKRDVFAACYGFPEGGVRVLVEPAAMTLDELIPLAAGQERPLLTGDGALRHAAELARETGGAVSPPHLGAQRASALLWLAQAAPALGAVPDPVAWEPDYLRAAGVERIAAARAAAEGR